MMLGKPPPHKYCFLIGAYAWCHHFLLSGLEVFTTIFLRFLTKTRLTKYDQSSYGCIWLFAPEFWQGPTNQWSYLVSLVFGKNCRKIGVNTSRPESKKWWHQAYAPIRKTVLGGLVQHDEYLLKTLLWHHHYLLSARLFHAAPSN